MNQSKPVMLKNNLRNKILSNLIFGCGWTSLFILVVMFWLPENIKEPAIQTMLGMFITAFICMLGLEEVKQDEQ